MRLGLFISLVFASFTGNAQVSGDSLLANKSDSLTILAYFGEYGLKIDSCANYKLYNEVHNWLGTPYKYGGKTASGIDCSGFSKKIYTAVYNKELQGGSRDIYKTVKPVSKKHLEEGDLLFFKIRKGQISHVGVYLGAGKFAHATTSAGVIISDLAEDYYKKYFFKAGRVLGLE